MVAALTGACDKYAQDKEEIRTAIDTNHRAIASRDAAGFIASVSQNTMEQLDRNLAAARSASRNEVWGMRPVDKALVVMLRNRCTKEQLRKFDSRAFIAWSMEEGWWDEQGDRDETIGSIKVVAGRTATVKMNMDGRSEAREVGLVKEDSGWKVDLADGSRQFDRRFRELTDTLRLDENKTILRIEAMRSGREPSHEIWDPPK